MKKRDPQILLPLWHRKGSYYNITTPLSTSFHPWHYRCVFANDAPVVTPWQTFEQSMLTVLSLGAQNTVYSPSIRGDTKAVDLLYITLLPHRFNINLQFLSLHRHPVLQVNKNDIVYNIHVSMRWMDRTVPPLSNTATTTTFDLSQTQESI